MRTRLPLSGLWIAAALAGCSEPVSVEVEAGPGLEFRMAAVLHRGYNSWEEHVVSCRSRFTGSAAREEGVPRGAAVVARLDPSDVLWLAGPGGSDALAAARRALRSGNGWMAFHQRKALRVSADLCRSWVEFVPAKHLEPRHVLRSPGYTCSDVPCLESSLYGARWQYRDLELALGADPSKSRMKFVLDSTALSNPAGLDVATDDGGRTWRVTRRAGPAPAAPFEPSPGRYVNEKR